MYCQDYEPTIRGELMPRGYAHLSELEIVRKMEMHRRAAAACAAELLRRADMLEDTARH